MGTLKERTYPKAEAACSFTTKPTMERASSNNLAENQNTTRPLDRKRYKPNIQPMFQR
jgi:hypothetical protein